MQYIHLDHYEFVKVIGPDARKFLQGQVSCDMDAVQTNESRRGAICNLKGRVVADFIAIAVEEGVILQTAHSMGQPMIDVLQKYAVFSKVAITLEKAAGKILGCFGQGTKQLLQQTLQWQETHTGGVFTTSNMSILTLDESKEQFLLIAQDSQSLEQFETLKQGGEQCDLSQWDRLDIEAGIIHIDSELSGEFTPQLLNYDLSGVIDFKKGCYTGQEVVARMFYRSTAKKRLTLLASEQPLHAESSVEYHENDASITTAVLRYSNAIPNTGDTNLLLAIIGTNVSASETPPRLTNNAESFLQILTMPYTK